MARNEELLKKEHYQCNVCGAISPLTETYCHCCNAVLTIYGNVVDPAAPEKESAFIVSRSSEDEPETDKSKEQSAEAKTPVVEKAQRKNEREKATKKGDKQKKAEQKSAPAKKSGGGLNGAVVALLSVMIVAVIATLVVVLLLAGNFFERSTDKGQDGGNGTTLAAQDSEKPRHWSENLLKSDLINFKYDELNDTDFQQHEFYGSGITRESVSSVTFLSSVENAPTKGLCDVSADKTASVLLWYEKSGKTAETYDVYIAAEGGMTAADALPFLFAGCKSLKSVSFGDSLHTENGSSTYAMFLGCQNLRTIDLSSLDLSSVWDMSDTFAYCYALESVDLGKKCGISYLSDIKGMFYYCSNLTSVDLSSLNTSRVTNMGDLFFECKYLESVDVSGFDTSSVTDMNCMFYGCENLKELDVSGFDTSKVTKLFGMFAYCSSLESLDVSSFDTSSATILSSMFIGCSSLTSLDVSGFDTSGVTDMSWMFQFCSSLKSITFKKDGKGPFVTDNVKYMDSMFSNCSSLESIDVSFFNTSSVTDMNGMFSCCSSLKSLDLSTFDTSSVTDMSRMFDGCSSLESLNILSFNTSCVTDMSWMFSDCESMDTFDISGFDTSSVTDMRYMFYIYGSDVVIYKSPNTFATKNVTEYEGFMASPEEEWIYLFE